MAVAITWRATQGGLALPQPLDHGTDTNGTVLAIQTIWIEHDGANPITGAVFYLGEKSGTYNGSATASADLAEIIAWGDGLAAGGPAEASEFGGFQMNMDAVNTFAAGNWDTTPTLPTFATPGTVNDLVVSYHTAVGNNATNGINLHVNMGTAVTATGVIANGSNDASFQARIQIPTDETTTGVREFDQKLRFTFTS